MSVIKSEFFYEGGELTHKASQPTEKLILDRNAELRKNQGVIQDLGHESGDSWGRMVASVPEIMYNEAIREGFYLDASDSEFAGLEMMRFLATDKGKMCLVQESL